MLGSQAHDAGQVVDVMASGLVYPLDHAKLPSVVE
jgi:hypothetical protein